MKMKEEEVGIGGRGERERERERVKRVLGLKTGGRGGRIYREGEGAMNGVDLEETHMAKSFLKYVQKMQLGIGEIALIN